MGGVGVGAPTSGCGCHPHPLAALLKGHKTSLSVRVWLRVHTEVYTEVKQLGSGGRRGFDLKISETTFETSVWSR